MPIKSYVFFYRENRALVTLRGNQIKRHFGHRHWGEDIVGKDSLTRET